MTLSAFACPSTAAPVFLNFRSEIVEPVCFAVVYCDGPGDTITDGMRDWLRSIGLFSEMIAWKRRFFVPVTEEGPAILVKLTRRHKLLDVVSRH